MKQTTIRVSNLTKEKLRSMGSKDESYDNIINNLILVYSTVPEDIVEVITKTTNPQQRACIYLGIVTDLTFENYTTTKYYEKYIKKLNAETFRAYYPKLVDENFKEGLQNENIISLLSNELVRFEDFTMSSEDMKLYFTFGITWSRHFN